MAMELDELPDGWKHQPLSDPGVATLNPKKSEVSNNRDAHKTFSMIASSACALTPTLTKFPGPAPAGKGELACAATTHAVPASARQPASVAGGRGRPRSQRSSGSGSAPNSWKRPLATITSSSPVSDHSQWALAPHAGLFERTRV